MKRFITVLVLVIVSGAFVAHAADATQFNGWISDSACGAQHAGSGSMCVKKCIEGGMIPVFVDQKKKAVWRIDNPGAVKGFYGDHVTITATANADKKSVHVNSITAAK